MRRPSLLCLLLIATCATGHNVAQDLAKCAAICDLFGLSNTITSNACESLCNQTSEVLAGPCGDAMNDWSGTAIGRKANFASANLLTWSQMVEDFVDTVVSDLKNNSVDIARLANIALNGDLTDYGKYESCVTTPGAEYCTSSLEIVMGVRHVPVATVAMCLPNVCTQQEIQLVFDKALQATNISNAVAGGSISIAATATCGDQSVDWETGTSIMVALCVILLLLIGVSTVFSLLNSSGEEMVDSAKGPCQSSDLSSSFGFQVLDAFSLPKNIAKFGEIRSGTATSCLDGIRVMSMCWVVMGHTSVWPFSMGQPGYANAGAIIPFTNQDAALGTFTGQAILSAFFSVDSFFFMSGFLALYIGLKKLANKAPIVPIKAAPFMYLDRFLRLTPAYFFVLLMYTYVAPTVSSGPFWGLYDQEICKKHWWRNLLYIQTLFTAFGGGDGVGCYGVSWYLADDMMFFYLVPFIIALALHSRPYVYFLLGSVSLVSIIFSFVIADVNRLTPQMFDNIVDSSYGDYTANYYDPPWTRIPPYLIGAAVGIFWRDHGESSKAALSSLLPQALLWVVAAALLGTCMWGLVGQIDTVPAAFSANRLACDFYVALSKPAWTVGLAALCVLCFARRGGPIQWFLEMPFFGYLSKLTYTVYLVHPTVLYIWLSSLTAPLHFGGVEFAMAFIGVLFFSTIIGFALHLCVEQPTANLLALLLTPRHNSPMKEQADSVSEADGSGSVPMLGLPLPFEGESSYLPPSQRLWAPGLLALPSSAPVVSSGKDLAVPFVRHSVSESLV